MANLIIYSVVVILVVSLAFISEKILHKNSLTYRFIQDYNGNLREKKFTTPVFNITIITIILSFYSAYLATSGFFPDTNRYAWSFLYRYPAYYGSFDSLMNSGTEVGFLLLNMLVGSVTDNPYWLFLLIAIVTTFINLYTASKISKSYTLIIFLYLISLYFYYSTFLLKQILAVSFANLAFLYYLKGKNIKCFVFSFIAIAFHASSIVLFPAFFAFKKIKALKSYFLFIICLLFLFISFGIAINKIFDFFPYFAGLLSVNEMNLSFGGGSLSSLFKGIPFYFITLLALIKRNKLIRLMSNADFFIISAIIYSISWLFTYNLYWFFRVGLYFLLPTLVLIPYLFSTIKNPKERVLYYLFLIFTLIIITYRQIYITLQ